MTHNHVLMKMDAKMIMPGAELVALQVMDHM